MRSALPRRALKGKTFPTVHNDSLAVVKRRQVNENPKNSIHRENNQRME
jgi:hypothetical protein